MNFLYPQFLYGLAALAIPIIIHLFNFRKSKKVYFSSNQFLKNIKKQASAKLRLKHLLVLAARLLFIFFLVMTFAQPYIPASNESASSEEVYIYFDNSLSMSNSAGGDLSGFESGLKYIEQIVDIYPKSARFKLLTNDFAPFSNSTKSSEELKETLTELELSGITRTFDEIYNRLLSDDITSRPDIYWISDFQKSTVGSFESLLSDTVHRHFMAPVRFTENSNIFIDSVYLANPFVMANEKNELRVSLRNSGQDEVEDLIVKLFINDIQAASASVNLQEDTRSEITFPLSYGLNPINKCRISFEEFPVVFDNEFYLTINQIDKINVLEIKNTTAQTPINQVFGNPQLFNLRSYHVNNLEYSLIASSDLVILNGISRIDPSLIGAVQEFVQDGGDALVIPAPTPDFESYDQLVDGIGVDIQENAAMQELASVDLSNPFYENIFEETATPFNMPEAANVIRWSYQAGKLIAFKNGDPYLSVFERNGKYYLLGSPLNPQFTRFHQHALFVPVMYRIAALSKNINERLYHTLNESTIVVNIDSLSRNNIYKLERDGEEIIPGQMAAGKNLILEMPKYILKSGFYSLTLDDETKKVLAFNQEKKESLLDQHTSDELRNRLSGNASIEIFNVEDAGDFSAQMQEKHQGTPLWRYALLLALFFLLTEVLLIRFL